MLYYLALHVVLQIICGNASPQVVAFTGFVLHFSACIKEPLWCNKDLGNERQARSEAGERYNRWVLWELSTDEQ